MKTKINNSFRRTLVAAVLVAGFATAGQAAEYPQVHVNFGDLNLSSEAGAAVLYQRIRNAAEQVCGTSGLRDLGAEAAAKACKARAIGEAVVAVHAPALTQVYEGKMGLKVERFAAL